ncbi:MAG: hypothetical protein Q9200_003420 [Gallowayella weberi]
MAGFDKSFSKLQITTADADVPPAKFIRCLANIDDKAKHRCSRKGAPDQKRAYTAKELEERVMDCLCQTHKYHLERQPILDNVLKAPAIGWSYSRALPAVCRPLRRYQAVNPIQPSKTGSTESGKVCNLKYSQHQSGAGEPDTKLQYQTNSPFLHRCTRSSSKYLRYAYTRYDASCLAPETSRTTVILGDKFPDRHGNSATKSCPKREKSDVFALPAGSAASPSSDENPAASASYYHGETGAIRHADHRSTGQCILDLSDIFQRRKGFLARKGQRRGIDGKPNWKRGQSERRID